MRDEGRDFGDEEDALYEKLKIQAVFFEWIKVQWNSLKMATWNLGRKLSTYRGGHESKGSFKWKIEFFKFSFLKGRLSLRGSQHGGVLLYTQLLWTYF